MLFDCPHFSLPSCSPHYGESLLLALTTMFCSTLPICGSDAFLCSILSARCASCFQYLRSRDFWVSFGLLPLYLFATDALLTMSFTSYLSLPHIVLEGPFAQGVLRAVLLDVTELPCTSRNQRASARARACAGTHMCNLRYSCCDYVNHFASFYSGSVAC